MNAMNGFANGGPVNGQASGQPQAGPTSNYANNGSTAQHAERIGTASPERAHTRMDSNGAGAGASAGASKPNMPNRIRKRQRIEYDPFKRPFLEHPGGWDPIQIEEIVSMTAVKRQKRTPKDLGMCDIRTLTMSLRSRINTEVSFALNSLGVLSANNPPEPPFLISHYPELFDELVELLEEAVEGADEEDYDEDRSRAQAGPLPVPQAQSKQHQARDNEPRAGYSSANKRATEDEYDFRPADSSCGSSADTFAGLNRADLVLALLALFRNFSYVPESLRILVEDARMLRASLQALQTGQHHRRPSSSPSKPLSLTSSQLLQGRKDVLKLLGNLGFHIALEKYPSWVGQAIIDLIDYFLELDSSSGSTVGLANAFGPGLDAALYALARIALPDSNREQLSQLPSFNTSIRTFILDKFAILVQLLPVADTDFQFLTSESSLLRIELVAMCLFNLAYIAPLDIRKKLRDKPGALKILARLVRKLYQAHMAVSQTQSPSIQHNQYLYLCQRSLEVLRILSEDEGSTGGARTTGSNDGIAWFGSSTDGRDGEAGTSNVKSRGSLLFTKQEFIELMSYAVNDRAILSSLADCT